MWRNPDDCKMKYQLVGVILPHLLCEFLRAVADNLHRFPLNSFKHNQGSFDFNLDQLKSAGNSPAISAVSSNCLFFLIVWRTRVLLKKDAFLRKQKLFLQVVLGS